ncbi:MAG: hypothetical protein ACOX6H_00280 [Christensenellales bacterium]
MNQYSQPILVSYANKVNQVKYKHKIKKKVFIYGLISGASLVMFVFSVYNILQIFI